MIGKIKLLLLLTLFFAFLSFLGVVAVKYAYNYYFKFTLDLPQEGVYLTVDRGEPLSKIVDSLYAKKLIKNKDIFEYFILYKNLARKIKAGEYHFKPKLNVLELIDILIKGQSLQYKVTFIEGSTFQEAVAKIQSIDKLNKKLSNVSLLKMKEQINPNYPFYEGMILAETYFYSKNLTDLKLLKQAHSLLDTYLTKKWNNRDKNLPYKNKYEALILASIIQKETGLNSEMPLIASVFVNRLKRGMLLQSDPTIIYGLGDEYKGDIKFRHLRQKTKYNTYVIKGLPPTPIALVGKKAIDATFAPEETRYLYFVAKEGGGHYLSKTLIEHNQAVKRYLAYSRKKRKK